MDPKLPFKLSPEYVAKAKAIYELNDEIEKDNGLSKVVYIRTYSRNIYDKNGNYIRNETIFDTWLRCVNGIYSLAKQKFPATSEWNEKFWQSEAFTMLKLFIFKKLSPSGRGLWNLGTPLVHSKQIGMALFNCAFITSSNIDEIKAEYFCFIMYGLMVGSGVGLDDAGEGKLTIRQPIPSNFTPCANVEPLCAQLREMMKTSKKVTPKGKMYLAKEIKYMENIQVYHPNQYTIFQVPDDRNGWIEALRRLLNSYFKSQYIVLFDYSAIRKKGEFLITSGGKASGPQPLAEALAIIRYLLQANIGKPLSSELILDIANIIGMMVVAGNVRRSSQIFCFRKLELADIKKAYVRIKDELGNVVTEISRKIGVSSIETSAALNDDDRLKTTYSKTGELEYIWTSYKVTKDSQGNLELFDKDQKLMAKLYGCVHMQKMIPYDKYRYRTMPEAWAGNSNNSFIVDNDWTEEEFDKILDVIIPMIDETSEPGIFNIKLCRHYGRLIDGYGDHDLGVDGLNPCGEITLQGMRKDGKSEGDNPFSAGGELCCLVQVNISKIEDHQDLCRVLKYATFLAKMKSTVRIEWKATDDIQHKNYRIGISLTGIMEHLATTKHDMDAFAKFCDIGYRQVKTEDKKISALFGIPESIKLTAVQPSGTVGKVLGTTSGMHGPMSEYVLIRVRISKEYSDLLNGLIAHGYDVEDDIFQSNTTAIASFPVKYREGIKTKKNFTLKEQFELLRILQTYWADNAVSVTIFFKDDEVDELRQYMKEYRHCIKCASFSKYFEVSSSQYKQLPQEEITQAEYLEKTAKLTKFSVSDLLPKTEFKEEEIDNLCSGEKCMRSG